ncbi:GDSL esterase/lipase EXL3-like [Oryza brachyantha]|nr:GDSL esterase/lipase EXL3-like [Oryza brachyantha]
MDSCKRSLVVVMVMAILHRCCSAAPVATAANQTRAPALFVFGDSIVDAGNNNAITTLVRCNFAPYGEDFPGHNATGRFSNGKVPGDILATQMGIKQYVPAYLGAELSDFDLLTGVTFASGGCGFDPLTAELVSVLTMDNQLDLFKEYKEKLRRIAGARRAAEIVSESLYLVVTGTDDLANTYFTTPFRRDYDLDSYIDFVVQCASDFIQKLLGMGARRVHIAGAPPIGCVPSQRTNAGGLDRDCVSLYNQAAVVYNARLEQEIKRLNGTAAAPPPGTVLKYIDLYTPLLDMIQRPAAYGFEVTNRGCCGTGVFEVTLTCNRYTAHACRDVDKFLFWDTYHLTERGYNILLSQVINKYGF